MAYKIKKTVVLGDSFIEHRYQKFPETFEGKWKKVGAFVHSNPSAMELTCQWCRQDWNARLKTWPISGKLFSYRVEGVTEADDFWEWEIGRCGNNKTCWGKKIGFGMLEGMYATFVRSSGKDNLVYTSITRKWDQCADFWSDCLPVVPNPKRHIYISMASKETAKYMNPNRMEMRYFDEQQGEATDRFKAVPISLTSLEIFLPEIARTTIEMYPGESGLKVSQYRKIPQWQNEGAHVETDWLPHEWRDGRGGYIPNIQHGWAGPVVSYWARLDATYRYFS